MEIVFLHRAVIGKWNRPVCNANPTLIPDPTPNRSVRDQEQQYDCDYE